MLDSGQAVPELEMDLSDLGISQHPQNQGSSTQNSDQPVEPTPGQGDVSQPVPVQVETCRPCSAAADAFEKESSDEDEPEMSERIPVRERNLSVSPEIQQPRRDESASGWASGCSIAIEKYEWH